MHATVLQVIDQLAAIAQNTDLRSELETKRTDARARLAHARAAQPAGRGRERLAQR